MYSYGGSTTTLEGLYLQDLRTGIAQCISVNPVNGKCVSASHPAVSADGSRVAFWSFTPLLASDVNGVWDIYLYDRNTAALSLVSVSATGQRTQGNESTSRIVAPAISADGRYVAFATTSGSLVANDTNGLQDVFVKDTQTGDVIRASVSASGAEGNGNSPIGQGERPSLSADGSLGGVFDFGHESQPTGFEHRGAQHLDGRNHRLRSACVASVSGTQTVISGDSLGRFVVFFSSDLAGHAIRQERRLRARQNHELPADLCGGRRP